MDISFYLLQNFEPIPLSNLENDTRRHYACPFCTKITRNKSVMVAHIRIHTGEKPFNCSICGYKTNQNSALKSHIRNKHGEKPFSCKICDYTTSQKEPLLSHIKKRHPLHHTELC